MDNTFAVTGLGLKIDKTVIMPGSELRLNQPAPSHWSRFGEPGKSGEKEMVVATPPATEPTQEPTGDEPTVDDILAMDKDALTAALDVREIEYDGRLGEDKLRDLLVAALTEGE